MPKEYQIILTKLDTGNSIQRHPYIIHNVIKINCFKYEKRKTIVAIEKNAIVREMAPNLEGKLVVL